MIYITLYILPVLCFIINVDETSSGYLPEECGRSKYENPRIIDGSVAELGQFPWMARIGMMKRPETIFYCGGTLINNYYVVTAANCKHTLVNIVRLGENYLNESKDCNKGICASAHQDIRIFKFIAHENYCSATQENDIALIELAKAAKVNDFVKPICFPKEEMSSDDLIDEPAFVAGWGMTNVNPDTYPRKLMYILAPSIDKNDCNMLYSVDLIESQLCMGYWSGKDACGGDSGGPVFKYMRTDQGKTRALLRGIVSYGLAACGTGPAVYTDASKFADWVLNNIHKR